MAVKGAGGKPPGILRQIGRPPKLTRRQRKLMSQLRRHSLDKPYATSSVAKKMELLELGRLGLVECQWSQNWAVQTLFAWPACQACVRGIRFSDTEVDGLVPFERCPECSRYEHDLAAAEALMDVAPVQSLDIEQHATAGFAVPTNSLDAAKHFLRYHWTATGR